MGELVDTGDAVRVLAFWNGTELADPFTYSLAGGPCEVVYATNRDDVHHFYPSGVTRLFPEFDLLADLGAEAYRGELFLDSARRPAGHVVALMSEPESDSAEIRALFRLIAQRVGAEFRRWKLDAALARSEERYRRLLDFLPDCVVIHRNGRVIYANSSATDALGAARREEVVGRPSLDLTHPDEWEAAGQRMGLSASGAEVTRETTRRYKRMDGTWFTGESSEVRVDFDDGVSTVDVFRDVTQRHRLEEELLQAKKLEAVGKLTGGVAHDFNNLLAVIRGNIDVLAAEGATQERVGAIVRATERGAELTDRLLSFARRQTLVPTTIECLTCSRISAHGRATRSARTTESRSVRWTGVVRFWPMPASYRQQS